MQSPFSGADIRQSYLPQPEREAHPPVQFVLRPPLLERLNAHRIEDHAPRRTEVEIRWPECKKEAGPHT